MFEEAKKHCEKLYNKYYKIVYFVCIDVTHNIEIAKDISHDSFVEIFSMINSGEHIKNEKSYLCQIARNKSLNYLKKENRVSGYNEYDAPVNDVDIDVNYIKALFKGVSPKDKNIVISHVLYDLSFREIGLSLNESVNTVKSKYRRAIKKMKGNAIFYEEEKSN